MKLEDLPNTNPFFTSNREIKNLKKKSAAIVDPTIIRGLVIIHIKVKTSGSNQTKYYDSKEYETFQLPFNRENSIV